MAVPVIHLVNPLRTLNGGSERRTLGLYDLLQEHAQVTLWAEGEPDPSIVAAGRNLRRLHAAAGDHPAGGTMVFVGCYWRPGPWVCDSRSERTVLVHNTPDQRLLAPAVQKLSALGALVEIVYAANWLRDAAGCPGVVHSSPIDLERFRPLARSRGGFTVGRVSRDVPTKHHPQDVDLYRALAAQGCSVRLMGASSLQAALPPGSGVELLAEGQEPADAFMQGLDCFYYRPHDRWVEPRARVVIEAMACGLPVVVYRHGGNAEHIRHGENGFLFERQQEALELILRLRGDDLLRQRVGRKARETAIELCGPQAMQEVAKYFLAQGRTRWVDPTLLRA